MNLIRASAFLSSFAFGHYVKLVASADVSSNESHRHLANGVDIIVELHDDSADPLPPGLSKKEASAARRNKASKFAQGQGVATDRAFGATIYGFSAQGVPPGQLKKLQDDPRVKSIELDGTVTLDPAERDAIFQIRQRNLQAQTTPWGIQRVGAGGNDASHGAGKRACVLDTGIDLDNTDLNVSSDCFNAFRRGKDGRSCDDANGHGTHVAGTIAALDNGFGVVGVAPGATVVPIKVLGGNGSGSYSGIIDGMEWAADNDCDVANLSLGGGFSASVNAATVALGQAGVKVILAAGNSGDDAADYSPASAEGVNIYTVSASDSSDRMASFSNYGSGVDVAGPGVDIPSLRTGGGTVVYSGTSMAAPHIAGLLLLSEDLCFDGRTVSNDPDGNPDKIAIMCGSDPPISSTTMATTTVAGTTTEATTQATTTQATTQATTTQAATTTTTTQTCLGWNARCDPSTSSCCDSYSCDQRRRRCR